MAALFVQRCVMRPDQPADDRLRPAMRRHLAIVASAVADSLHVKKKKKKINPEVKTSNIIFIHPIHTSQNKSMKMEPSWLVGTS